MGYKFLDFGQAINDQLEKSLIEVLHSGFWSTGPQSKLLEESLSKIYQLPCVTTSSGGTALQTVSLLFPQIKKIAVQSNTYFASCLPWVTANKEIIILGSNKNILMPDISIIKDALSMNLMPLCLLILVDILILIFLRYQICVRIMELFLLKTVLIHLLSV